ncbi:MAG TPA: flagellar biosynthesis protein FlhF [Anaeromyxobacteraceae bacterium]|nr:flagellar biosynthesis protein FlhF [Anaeromyxobacteraceae bacterium]
MQATVRTFRAPDTASALAAVKAALGPDAVLLSTRNVEGGMFRKPEVEVTAALRVGACADLGTHGRDDQLRARRVAQTYAERSAAQDSPAANGRLTHGAGRPVVGASADLHVVGASAGLRDTAMRDDALAVEIQSLRRSVEEARRSLSLVTREARSARELQIPPAAADVHALLVARGVETLLAEELVRQAMALAPSREPAASMRERITATVRDLVGERLVPSRAPWLQDRQQVVALVGPTGVGKTTTIAKIAARALLESKKKVALLTVDTYRIGACDQLARYGEIMSVPVLVARDATELVASYERLKDADLVLVDTAGRSVPEDVARQAALVRAMPRVQVQLVVSAASGALDLAAVAERYRAVQPDRLVVTKLDEAAGPGAILSAAVRVGRPVSCVTDGQRVPEDLHAVTGPRLVDLVIPGEARLPEQE